MKHRKATHSLFLVFFALIFTATAFAQTAQVTGRITDQTEAVIAGAAVTATNTGTGINREAVSNEEGYFTLPLLNPGEYRIAVKKDGFKPVAQSGVVLQVNQVARLDYAMEAGALTETVSITANTTAALETETSSLGKVVDQQRIQNLPLLGRNPYSLAGLVPRAAFGRREPTIFWQPGKLKPGVVTGIGSTMDLLPTFCAMAGVKAPSDRVLDGYDLSAPLLNKGNSPRQFMPYWRGSKLMALRHGAFKAHFITQSEYGGEAAKTHATPELYNLDIDPSEKWNVAAQHPEVIAEMRRLAEEHKQAIPPVANHLDKRITK